MSISTVRDAGDTYEVTLESGAILWVPKDSENADNVRVQAWVADGGSIS